MNDLLEKIIVDRDNLIPGIGLEENIDCGLIAAWMQVIRHQSFDDIVRVCRDGDRDMRFSFAMHAAIKDANWDMLNRLKDQCPNKAIFSGGIARPLKNKYSKSDNDFFYGTPRGHIDDVVSTYANKMRVAAKQGNIGLLSRLASDCGLGYFVRNKSLCTAASAAAEHGQVDVLRFLIDKGANINSPEADGCTLLHYAVKSIDCVRLLVAHGANINAQNKDGHSALHRACELNASSEVIEYLLDNGADIELMSVSGKTPLYLSVENRNLLPIKTLISRGADIETRDVHGITPFMRSLYSPASFDEAVSRMLLDNGARLDININRSIASLEHAYLSGGCSDEARAFIEGETIKKKLSSELSRTIVAADRSDNLGL